MFKKNNYKKTIKKIIKEIIKEQTGSMTRQASNMLPIIKKAVMRLYGRRIKNLNQILAKVKISSSLKEAYPDFEACIQATVGDPDVMGFYFEGINWGSQDAVDSAFESLSNHIVNTCEPNLGGMVDTDAQSKLTKETLNESYYCNGAGQNPTTHPACKKHGEPCINWEENTAGTMGQNVNDPDDWQCIPNELNVAQGGDPLSADEPSSDFDTGTGKPNKNKQLSKLAARNMVKRPIKGPTMACDSIATCFNEVKGQLNEAMMCYTSVNHLFGVNFDGGDGCKACGGCYIYPAQCNGTTTFDSIEECQSGTQRGGTRGTPGKGKDKGNVLQTKIKEKLAEKRVVGKKVISAAKNIFKPTITPSADKPNEIYKCYECRNTGGWFSKMKCHHTSTSMSNTGRPNGCLNLGHCQTRGCSDGEGEMRSMDMEPSLDYMMESATKNIFASLNEAPKLLNILKTGNPETIVRNLLNSPKYKNRIKKTQISKGGERRVDEGPFCCWRNGGCCFYELTFDDREHGFSGGGIQWDGCCDQGYPKTCCGGVFQIWGVGPGIDTGRGPVEPTRAALGESSLDRMMNEATARICEEEGRDYDGDITNFKITPADGGKTINVDQNHELYQNIIRQISNSNGKIVKQLTKGQDSLKGNRLNEGPFCCWLRGGCCEWTHYLNLGYQDRAEYWEVRYPACCGNSSKGRCC